MSQWPSLPLGDIFDIARGGSPRPIDAFLTDDPSGINWIMIGDATEGTKYISATKKRIRVDGVRRSRAVKQGDFLLTNSMSFGKPYILQVDGCIHDGWLVLSPKHPGVDPDFFYHLLGSQQIYAEFERRAAGATVKNLNIDLVRDVNVHVPPLPEQRRIADILDKAEALRAKRREALGKLDELVRAVFLEMFGDPSNAELRFEGALLGDAVKTTSGGTPSRTQSNYFGGSIPWVKSGELNQNMISTTEEFLTEDGLANCSAKIMPSGTVLIAMYGATAGAVSQLGIEAATNQAICCVSPSEQLTKDYLIHLLRCLSPTLLIRRVGGAQPNLSQETIRSLRVPVPPLPLQQDFARRVEAIDRLKDAHRRSLAELDALFASLQHRAFRGEL